MRLLCVVLGLGLVFCAGWIGVARERKARQSAFRIHDLSLRVAEVRNENDWLRGRVAAKTVPSRLEAAARAAGLDLKPAPTIVVPRSSRPKETPGP